MESVRTVILRQLKARRPGASICPSEVARELAEDWRPLMDSVRASAIAMADAGEIVITQRDQAVDGRTARGPIRLRLPKLDAQGGDGEQGSARDGID